MKTYSPKAVQVIYGNRILTGFMDGTFIEADKTSDDWAEHIGADGEGARVQSADESGTVTLTLMQTSASNDYLSGCRNADRASSLGTKSLVVKDGSGRSLIFAAEAWIKKVAKSELSNDKGSRQWVFVSTNMEHFVGGNG